MNCGGICDLKNVRITPPVLEFIDPFEGKTYKQTLEIQNISLSMVFVRIGKPSSYSFRIKTISRGQHLSPGLTVVKVVKLCYTHVTAQKCFLPIYIDNTCYQYEIVIVPSAPKLTVTPQSIDFGVLHVGLTSAMRIIKLRNEGNKASRFLIDISKKDPQLMAEPSRGVLQPRSSIDIQIKLATFKKTTLMQEFWIACDKPIRVLLKGSVIVPKFEVLHPICTDRLTLIDFPLTYIGNQSVQTLLIRNYSGMSAMFCVLEEVNDCDMNINSGRKCDSNYKNFEVFPKDGHLEPKEARIIYFTFRPSKLTKHEKSPDFYMCSFQICRVPWKELDPDEQTVPESTCITENKSVPPSESISQTSSFSSFSLVSALNTGNVTPKFESASAPIDIKQEEEKTKISVYLHGIAKVPELTVVPDALSIAKVSMGERNKRVLEFTNMSHSLPIILRYSKVAYVDVERKMIFLKPAEKMQVSIFITPHMLGKLKISVKFDLMFYNQPKVNNEYKVIGKICIPVVINVTANCKKRNDKSGCISEKSELLSSHLNCRPLGRSDELIGFTGPGDGKSSTEVDGDFDEIVTKYHLENVNNKCNSANNAKKHLSDYSLTDGRHLLSMRTRCRHPPEMKLNKDSGDSSEYFIPLTPSELNKIIVSPRIIKTGEVSSFNKYYFKVKVNNTSANFIHLRVAADKASLLLPDGDRKIIPSNSELDVNMEYITSSPGYYTASINFIVNHSSVCVVTLLADVVLKSLKLSTTQLTFLEDETYKFVDIYNQLDKDISFRWHFQQTNFGFDPAYGVVEAKSCMACIVTYSAYSAGPSSAEAEFISGDKQNVHVGLLAQNAKYNYLFEKDTITMNQIPLNLVVKRNAILKNLSHTSICFTIKNPEPICGIKLTPSTAVIRGRSDCIININILMKTCCTFSCNVKFNIAKSASIDLHIQGTVVYPNVTFTPNKLLLKKIPAGSYDTWKLKVDNHSLATAMVNIDLRNYSEYRISKTKDYFCTKQQEEFLIEPQSSASFFLYFSPSDVSCGTFYLPVILNNLIGPPIINDPLTSKVRFYMEKAMEYMAAIEIPQRMPCVEVERRTTQPRIKISKNMINFAFTPWNTKSKTQYELIISNPQKVWEELCIRTDDLKSQFSIEHARGKSISRYTCSIVCSLNPREEVVLLVSFSADNPGEYRSSLPVYLRNDDSDKPHTFLYFKGTYPKPLIAFDDVLVILVPFLPEITISGCLTLKVGFHKENCRLTGKSDYNDIVTSIPGEYDAKNINGAEFEVCVSVDLTSKNKGSFSSNIFFECTCGGTCEVPVRGVVENCYITNHSFIQMFMVEEFTNHQAISRFRSLKSGNWSCDSEYNVRSSYTRDRYISVSHFFFTCRTYPILGDDFTNYMDAALEVAANWVYTQGFFGQHYFNIPEDIERLPDFESQRKNATKKSLWIMPFAQLLVNLAGTEMITYLKLRTAPSTPLERVLYCYAVYKRAIIFLEKLGANLPHILPEHLLDYSNYKSFMQNVNDSETPIGPMEFYLLSKQTWLDLILQTYKVLILFRLTARQMPLESENSTSHQDLQAIDNQIKADDPKTTDHQLKVDGSKAADHHIKADDPKAADRENRECIFGAKELMLMEWLDFNYQLVLQMLWSKSNKYLDTKQVDNFETALNDGLVFAAVTITYCPYLKSHFSNLYLFPIAYEENLHNAIKVTQAWEMLKLSFVVRPSEIVKPHALQMVMLASYLFEVLPDLSPTECVEFKTGLSTSITKLIKLKNENQFETSYKVLFFDNESNCFCTNQDKIVISPKSTAQIYITYTATFLKYNKATLVLCGECTGYHYAKNRALTLIGEPDITYMSSVFTISCHLYKILEVPLTCKSPYETSATYKLRIFSREPKTLSEVIAPSPLFETYYHCVRRFYTEKSEYEFNKSGTCNIKGIACALGNVNRTIWIYFRNPTVGDFAIQLDLNVVQNDTYQVINVQIPKQVVNTSHYVRGEHATIVYMNIPHQHVILWDAAKEMVLRLLTGDELEFWKNLVKTRAGIHLLQRLFLENKDLPHIFPKRNEYNIIFPKQAGVSLPSSLVIEHEFDSGHVSVPVELKQTKKLPRNFKFYLKSVDGIKVRQYVTNFMYTE